MSPTSAAKRTQGLIRSIAHNLPGGSALPERTWVVRHRVIRVLLGANAVVLFAYGLARGYAPGHVASEIALLSVCAGISGMRRLGRTAQAGFATFGLVSASALAVHLSGGTIEAHFHFFVVLGVIALYQHWMPLLLALGYVVLHHGVIGVLAPTTVYNHPAAIAHPWRWALVHAAFVLAASAVNIASWRMNEMARAESTLILNSVGEGIFGLDLAGTVTFINPAAAAMLGIHSEGLHKVHVHDLVHGHGEHRAQDCPLANACTREGENTDDVFEGAQGRLTVEYSRTDIVRKGTSVGTVVTFRDISDRLAAERHLHHTLSLLTATLESTADGILVVDEDGSITSLNAKFAEMWRIPPEILASGDDGQALGFVLEQLQDPEGFLRKVRELYAQPDAESFDLLAFKDGRVFERYSKPQRVNGVPVGRVWSFRDVTERNRLDEMKNGFLSAVSHELRTPLAGVLGYAVTLNRADLELSPEDRRTLVNRLEGCARKLERLLTDTIDLDRLSRGILEPLRTPTDVGALVRRVAADVDTGDRRITVRGKDLVAHVDAAKGERIVENLLINALRHTPSGTPIEITIAAEDDSVLIAVDDHGPGVPDEHKEEIFNAFHRGPHVASHSPGFGIGLSLVANFAALHGGRAWVEDRPGGGASFRVSLHEALPVLAGDTAA